MTINTRDFDGVLERIRREGHPYKTPRPGMIIASDPAGNGIEILKR